MTSIKSFIYLDEYKMYSISSQIFEGLTEYISRSDGNKLEESSEQRAPFGSGRIMANIITTHHNQTERRFMHDYAYNLFENKLLDLDKILEVNHNNIGHISALIHDATFIKIKGRASFQDTKAVHELINIYKELYYALNYVSKGGNSIDEVKEKLKSDTRSITDRNKRALAKDITKKKIEGELKKFDAGLSDEFLFNM